MALGDGIMAGEQVSAEELEVFGNHPVISLWRKAIAEPIPTAAKIGSWVEGAFWDTLGQGRSEEKSADRTSYGKAMRFSYDHRLDINELLARYRDQNHACRAGANRRSSDHQWQVYPCPR